MRTNWSIAVATITWVLLSANSWARDNGVILLYHHVSESTPKVTSVSPDTFRQHMQYLADHHTVLPLKQVVEALQNNQPLPDKAIVITFDDGYENIYTNAHPILKKFAFPYTVFINPPLIGKVDHQLDWQQITTMASENAAFANHGKYHTHLLKRNQDESQQEWLTRNLQDIEDAETMLAENIGYSLKYFAYPYGEFNTQLKNKLGSKGYVGFAQHSGGVASHSDFTALPRYPAAGIYGDIKTLKVKMASLAMPVIEVSVQEPEVQLPFRKQNIKFTLATDDLAPKLMNCFQSGQVLTQSIDGNQVTVNLKPISKPGRHRINCTVPSTEDGARFYWFSQPFFIPTETGEWLD